MCAFTHAHVRVCTRMCTCTCTRAHARACTHTQEITHESHKHSLKKTTTEALGAPYGGGYSCDICEHGGNSWVYHCDTCSFDAHPKCVGI